MEYMIEIGWLTLWPIVIFISYKLIIKNILKFEQKEKSNG
jgi:hypothetical protein